MRRAGGRILRASIANEEQCRRYSQGKVFPSRRLARAHAMAPSRKRLLRLRSSALAHRSLWRQQDVRFVGWRGIVAPPPEVAADAMRINAVRASQLRIYRRNIELSYNSRNSIRLDP